MRYQRQRSFAFTLVELLVVIAIIGVLVALLLPAVQSAREAARRSSCTNNLKQIGLAGQMYHDSYGYLPPGLAAEVQPSGALGKSAYAWSVFILPYLEQQALYDLYAADRPNLTEPQCIRNNGDLVEWAAQTIPVYMCPSSAVPEQSLDVSVDIIRGCGKCDYKGNTGDRDDGALIEVDKLEPKKNIGFSFREFTDGTSSTFFVGESSYFTAIRASAPETLIDPALDIFGDGTKYPVWVGAVLFDESNLAETDCGSLPNVRSDDDSFYSEHPGIVQFVMVDGSVQTINENIDVGAYVLQGVRNDGLVSAIINCESIGASELDALGHPQ